MYKFLHLVILNAAIAAKYINAEYFLFVARSSIYGFSVNVFQCDTLSGTINDTKTDTRQNFHSR